MVLLGLVLGVLFAVLVAHDPIAVEDIMRIVHDLKNRGIGVLVTDHNVHEALKKRRGHECGTHAV